MKESYQNAFKSLFVLSLLIRITYAFYLSDALFAGDAKGYYDHALYLLGKAEHIDFKWISFWSPGESLYLSVWIYVFGTSKCVIVSSMLAVWTAFFFIWNAWASFFLQAKTRFFILLIFSIFPTFIHHSVVPLTHLPATTCMLAVFYLLHSPLRAKQALKIGAIFGFLLLIRPSNMLLGLLFPFFIQQKKQILLVCLTSLLVVGSWSVYLYKKTDTFIFISESNAYNLYMGNHPETPKYATWWWATHTWENGSVLKREADSLLTFPAGQIGKNFQSLALHYIAEKPSDFVLRSLNRVRCFFAFDTFTGAMLAERHHKYVAYAAIGIDAVCYMLFMGLFLLSFLARRCSQMKADNADNISYQLAVSSEQFCKPCISQLSTFHSQLSTFHSQLSTFHSQLSTFNSPFFIFHFSFSILLLSLPYFFSFSHPTYHFAIFPLIAIGAGVLLENKEKLNKNIPVGRKAIVLSLLLAFVAIQIEWIYFWIQQK